MIDKSKVLIGSDFEMFLVNRDGKVISAIPFNNGTKDRPEKIKEAEGCCIQRDGILEECNIPPLSLDQANEFWSNIKLVKDYIDRKFAKKNDLRLVCCPTKIVDDDQLQDDEAKQIGCSIDFNAWNEGQVNDKPSFDDSGLRSAGFHIHISFSEYSPQTCVDLMKLFDLFLTVPFVLLDKDKERRKLYGKAGAFRLCNYGESQGFEARTLSGICSNDQRYIDYIFHQLNVLFDYYNEFGLAKVDLMSYKIVECINDSNEELATELCKEFNVMLLLDNIDDKYEYEYDNICELWSI